MYLKEGQLVYTEQKEFDLEKYAAADIEPIAKLGQKGVTVSIESSRGCPWGHCMFCASSEMLGSKKKKRRWRARNLKHVLTEIGVLADYGIQNFGFIDEEFVGPGLEGIQKVQALARGIIKISKRKNHKFSFNLSCRVDSIWDDRDSPEMLKERESTFRLLKQAGLNKVFLGVESGSDSQLKRYGKGLKVFETESAIQVIRKLNIKFDMGFIMFDPEVTLKEVQENCNFLIRNRLLEHTSWFANVLRVQIGTPFAKLYRNRPDLNLSKEPDPNTLQYSCGFSS